MLSSAVAAKTTLRT